jgi:hypothetical protein
LAEDSTLDETIPLVEELQREMRHWLEDLSQEDAAIRDAKARQARRDPCKAERRAERRAA